MKPVDQQFRRFASQIQIEDAATCNVCNACVSFAPQHITVRNWLGQVNERRVQVALRMQIVISSTEYPDGSNYLIITCRNILLDAVNHHPRRDCCVFDANILTSSLDLGRFHLPQSLLLNFRPTFDDERVRYDPFSNKMLHSSLL